MNLFQDAGKSKKKIAGYKVKINKRKYPDGIYNYCKLILDDEIISLGDPVGDLRKSKTIKTLKSLIQMQVLMKRLGEDLYCNILEAQKDWEIFDWLDDNLDKFNKENEKEFIKQFKNNFLKRELIT